MNSIIEAQQDFFEFRWIPEIVAPGLRMHNSRGIFGYSEYARERDRAYDKMWEAKNRKMRDELKSELWDSHITNNYPPFAEKTDLIRQNNGTFKEMILGRYV